MRFGLVGEFDIYKISPIEFFIKSKASEFNQNYFTDKYKNRTFRKTNTLLRTRVL